MGALMAHNQEAKLSKGKRNIGWTPRHETALQEVYKQMIALGIPCERGGQPNTTAILQYALEQAAKAGKQSK